MSIRNYIQIPSIPEIQYFQNAQGGRDHAVPLSIDFTTDGFVDDFGLGNIVLSRVLNILELSYDDGRSIGRIELPIYNPK